MHFAPSCIILHKLSYRDVVSDLKAPAVFCSLLPRRSGQINRLESAEAEHKNVGVVIDIQSDKLRSVGVAHTLFMDVSPSSEALRGRRMEAERSPVWTPATLNVSR